MPPRREVPGKPGTFFHAVPGPVLFVSAWWDLVMERLSMADEGMGIPPCGGRAVVNRTRLRRFRPSGFPLMRSYRAQTRP